MNSRQDFRRHVIIEDRDSDTGDLIWKHDVFSSMCIKQNYVEAVTSLDDKYHIQERDVKYFDLIEFTNQSYAIKRVFLNSSAVVHKNLEHLSDGRVNQLLKCVERQTPVATVATTIVTESSDLTTTKQLNSNAHCLINIQLLLFCVLAWITYLKD